MNRTLATLAWIEPEAMSIAAARTGVPGWRRFHPKPDVGRRRMGMALPAELNGYPGPSHMLELADKLELRPDQISAVRSLFESMRSESIPLGARLIEVETELDRQFATRAITPDSLRAVTAVAARTQGELRETHLKYHLSTAALLDPEQMRRYASLRGYQGQAGHQHHQ